ncbi:MAG: hypothetical protein HYZ69_00195, partial [Candidatus Colwellbacteria bacterium]|nr:hypothetical protein [Candidatus Colwellbacteria bacterium]
MLFILALIVMAYGTIFNIKGYDFKSLIPKFLIAALLINFSLVLGTLVIDGTQILNNTFLSAMGDISGRLGDGLNPAQILPTGVGDISNTEAIANAVTGSILTLIFSIFLLFAFLVSVAVPLAVAFARIPILWALLIVSPMAWSKKDEVLAGLGQDFVYSELNGLQSNFTFGLLFYYAMVAIFLIGGTKVAMSAGRFSGTGIVSVAKWGRGIAMRRLGVTAVQRAAEQKLAQVKEEGLPGRFGLLYGGERALDEQTARWAKRFGVRGADIKLQQTFVDRAGKEYSELETKYRLGQVKVEQLKSIGNSGPASNARVYAARKMLAKTGQLDTNISQRTFSELGNNALAMEDFAKTASGAKWSSMSGPDVRSVAKASGGFSSLATPTGTAARREAIKHVQGDKLAITDIRPGSEFDINELKEYINLMGGPTTSDAKDLIKEVGKYRPDLVWDLSRDPAYSTIVPRTVASRTDFIKGVVNRSDNETLAYMPKTIWETDTDFEDALREKFNRRTSLVDKDRFKAAVLDEIAKTPNSTEKTAAAFRIMI